MAVQSVITSITYTAAGGASFAVPFYFISQGDLFVQSIDSLGNVITYVLNGDYTITGTPNAFGDYNNGGNVVFNIAPPNGFTILIVRNTPKTQTVVLIDNSPFTADTFNHVFDKLTLIAQEEGVTGFLGIALGPPTIGVFTPGQFFKNGNPAPGAPWGWVYTTGGWRDFADISLLL